MILIILYKKGIYIPKESENTKMTKTLKNIVKFQYNQQKNETIKKGKFWKFKHLSNTQKSNLIKDLSNKTSSLKIEYHKASSSTLRSNGYRFEFLFKDFEKPIYNLFGIMKNSIKIFILNKAAIKKDENDNHYIYIDGKKKSFTKMSSRYKLYISLKHMSDLDEEIFEKQINDFEKEINRLYDENTKNKTSLELLEACRIGKIGELYIEQLLKKWKIKYIYDPKTKYDLQLENKNLEIKTSKLRSDNRFEFKAINLNETHKYDYFIFLGIDKNESKYFILNKKDIIVDEKKWDKFKYYERFININGNKIKLTPINEKIYNIQIQSKYMNTIESDFELSLELNLLARE